MSSQRRGALLAEAVTYSMIAQAAFRVVSTREPPRTAKNCTLWAILGSRSQDTVLMELSRTRYVFPGIDLRLTYKPQTSDRCQAITSESDSSVTSAQSSDNRNETVPKSESR